MAANATAIPNSALDRARAKAYWRLLPLLFVSYMIAYVDRNNVAIAKLTMVQDIPGFDNSVIGLGAGVFFIGYFLLEIPGTLLVERWSARKWISRIMLSWGVIAALTAFVGTPLTVSVSAVNALNSALGWKLGVTEFQFYCIRFLLGLAEAGFYPGVIVYLTHWFPLRDRSRALAYFFVATPIAQMISPKISNLMLRIGTDEIINGATVHHPEVLGLEGWQWIYIFWGIPAIVLGFLVLRFLPDKPRDARWLTPEEQSALEAQLQSEQGHPGARRHLTVLQALRHPKVLLLAFAYFCTVTANYGIEFFLPSILQQWYQLKFDALTWLVVLPPCLALAGQLFVGWNSDRVGERRLHTVLPIALGAVALALTPLTQGNLALTILAFMVGFAGVKAYLPAFWALPNLFLSSAAAAGSIGFINSVGNLGGFLGPSLLGFVREKTGSYVGGIYYLAGSMLVTSVLIWLLGLGRKETAPRA